MLEDDCSSAKSTNTRWVLKHMVLVEKLVPLLLDLKLSYDVCKLLIVSCFHPNGEAIFFEVVKKVSCYEMQLRRVKLQHISPHRIPFLADIGSHHILLAL